MSDVNREFLTAFIEMCRSHPCLWQVKNRDYRNNQAKNKAYKLHADMSQVYNPGRQCDIAFVKTKIRSMRTVFKKECEKVKETTRSGAGAEEVCKPKLWYFDLLTFTLDQQEIRTMRGSDDADDAPGTSREEPSTPDANDPDEGTSQVAPGTEEPQGQEEQGGPDSQPPGPNPRLFSRKRKAAQPTAADMMSVANKFLQERRDPFCSISVLIQERVGSISAEQRTHMDRVILQVVEAAQVGKLTPSKFTPESETTVPSANAPAIRPPGQWANVGPYAPQVQPQFYDPAQDPWGTQNFGSGGPHYHKM